MEFDDSAITPGRKITGMTSTTGRRSASSQAKPLTRKAEAYHCWTTTSGSRGMCLVVFWRHVTQGWCTAATDDTVTARLLHIGCGNSNLADAVTDEWAREMKRVLCRKEGKRPALPLVQVLNMDICEKLISRLRTVFPSRYYAVGDCCAMVDGTELSSRSSPTPTAVASAEGEQLSWAWLRNREDREVGSKLCLRASSVDIVLDKGTLDALLSAFPGEDNPNAERLFQQVLRVLRPGGLMVLITINSKDVIMPYVFGASAVEGDEGSCSSSFEVVTSDVLDVGNQFEADIRRQLLRIETLGRRYTIYVSRCFCVNWREKSTTSNNLRLSLKQILSHDVLCFVSNSRKAKFQHVPHCKDSTRRD